METVREGQHLAENGAVLRNVTSKIPAERVLYYWDGKRRQERYKIMFI